MKKQRITSALIMAAMLLSMTACGSNTETPESATEGTKATTTTAAVEENTAEATTTTTPETEEATTTTEAPVELPEITGYKLFMNSCLSFSAYGKNYVLNIADKKMYEYETEGLDDFYAIKGNVALFGRFVTYNDGVARGSGIYNLETKEIIASAEENGIMPYSYYAGFAAYIPVLSKEAGFDGDTYSVGLIDESGTWTLPMSSDYEICSLDNLENGQLYIDSNEDTSILIADLNREKKIYDFKNNKLIDTNDLVANSTIWRSYGNNILLCDNQYQRIIGKYNIDTGELTALDLACQTIDFSNGLAIFDRANKSMTFLDNNYNNVDFDFSGYELGRNTFYDFNNECVVFDTKNSEGDDYIILLNNDGSRAVDPVRGTADAGYISGDYVVLDKVYYYDGVDSYTNDYIINYKTGEIKTYTGDTYDIIGCDSATGMLLVKTDSAIYLADVSDPDTLINPLAFAE